VTDDRGLRDAFRREFDDEKPRPGAYPAALQAAFERKRGHGGVPRWAVPTALLAVAMLTALALVQRAPRAQPFSTTTPQRSGEAAPELVPAAAPVDREPAAVHVAALDSRVALVSAGDVIEQTTDGGVTWTVLFPGEREHRGTVRDLEWVTASVAFAATSYGLIRIDSRAGRWTLVNSRQDLRRLDFLTLLEGYAIVADRIVRTVDGGDTFADMDVGLEAVSWIQWVTAEHAWAAGPSGVVATSDGGHTWSRQLDFYDPPHLSAWTQVGFRDPLHGFAYHRAGAAGRLLYTANGGESWTAAVVPAAAETSDLVVTGLRSAELVASPAEGPSQLCATSDTGATWSCTALPLGGVAGEESVKGRTHWLALHDSGAVFGISQDGSTWSAHRRPFL
jgi:photosystem II stability/assembly factor-like uncharacterized protein